MSPPASQHADPVIRDLEIMSVAHRYQRWMYEQFRPHLGQRIVECGAGIGNMTRLLLDRELVIAVDIHGPCLDELRRRLHVPKNVLTVQLDVGSPDLVSLQRYAPDTILCINMLEHIEDDAATLREMFELLPQRGRLLILVPAFQGLYGSIDRRLEHYRRYGKPLLAHKLREAGFAVMKLFYMNSIATIGWFLNNRVLNRTDQSSSQVRIFDRWVVPWLSRVERLVRPPFGLSLIAVAQKP